MSARTGYIGKTNQTSGRARQPVLLQADTVKVAIPRYGESVAPCFEYSATMAIYSIAGTEGVEQIDVTMYSRVAFDRIRLIRDYEVEVVICGGVEDKYEDMLRANGVRVFSWVSGNVEDLLRAYLEGRLIAGSGRLTPPAEDSPAGSAIPFRPSP